jgi:hypothetical protein
MHFIMRFSDLPSTAAWRHGDLRTGLEASSFERRGRGWSVAGSTTAVQAGAAWWVAYEIELGESFVTRRAVISAKWGTDPSSEIVIEGDGVGHWLVDGRPAPGMDGCLDVDLESSAMTNSLPIRRMSLAGGEAFPAPAVYVRVKGLIVERLEQVYTRRDDSTSGPTFDYEAPAFDFACRIEYDTSGLVLSYPGIAERLEW